MEKDKERQEREEREKGTERRRDHPGDRRIREDDPQYRGFRPFPPPTQPPTEPEDEEEEGA